MKNITFINAGAGSGKTHKLNEILADWIIKDGNEADRVLLTTFTKKAAVEIRERSQAKLLEEKRFEDVTKLQNAYMGTVHSIGYSFIKKYWYLIGISPQLTEISEKERDVFFSNAISEIPTESDLFKLNDLCYQFNFQKHDNELDFTTFNQKQWKDDVITIINTALTNNIDIIEDDRSLQKSFDKWEKIFRDKVEEINIKDTIKYIEKLYAENPRYNRDIPDKGLTDDYNNFSLNHLISIKSRMNQNNLRLLFDIERAVKELKNIYNTNKTKYVQDSLPEINTERTAIFKKSGKEYIRMIFELAKKSLKRYKEYKNENGLVDYTDMEVYFLQLLDEETVIKEIKQTIKLVMVDEFQDSNPIQLSIFMKLSKLTQKSYWVGDPKQAIYSFRGSDPVLIGDIIKEFGKEENKDLKLEILKMSWRSLPELVDFSNAIFEKRMLGDTKPVYLEDKNQIHGPGKKCENKKAIVEFDNWINGISICPLDKKETISLFPVRTSSDAIRYPIQFWNFLIEKTDKNGAKYFNGLVKDTYYTKLSEKVASLIRQGQDGNLKFIDKTTNKPQNLKGSDICILIDSNSKVADLAKKCNEIGIPVNAIVDGLTETVEYRILQNIISLFIDPNNALSSAELAYLCGETESVESIIESRLSLVLPELEKHQNDKDYNIYVVLKEWLIDSEHKLLIEKLREQSKHLSISYLLRKIIGQFNVFQKLLSFNNSELRQSNVLKILGLVDEYEDYCLKMNIGCGLNSFFDFVESSKENKQFAINTNDEAVNIMTYHKAKGLEWPMVILMDIDEKIIDHKFERDEIFKTKVESIDNLDISNPLENRLVEFSFWPFGSGQSLKQEVKDCIGDEILNAEYERTKEKSRLMYVGITRARDYLIFASNKNGNANWLEDVISNGWKFGEALEKMNYKVKEFEIKDFFDLGKGHSVYYERILPETVFDYMIEPKEKSYFIKQIPALQDRPYLRNPSKEDELINCQVEGVKILHERLKINTRESTELGNTLHYFLYIKDKSYFKNQVELSEPFNILQINKDQFIENTERFKQWLNEEFNVVNEYHELPMEVVIDGRLAKGEADLVLETNEGLILIDYKTYAGNDDVVENKTGEFYAGKYSGQLDLYAQMLEKTFDNKKVVKKLIYYVVQGKIVELIKIK